MNNLIDYSDIDTTQYPSITLPAFKDNTLNDNSYIYGKFNNLKFSNRYGYVIFITNPLDIQEI